jgi:sugar phosphate permease
VARSIFFAWLVYPYCGGNSGGAHIGRRSSDKNHKHRSSAGETLAAARVPRSQVFRSYTFLTLIAVIVILGISHGVLMHLIPMLTDRGMTAAAVARLFSLLGVSAIAGHLLIGFCFDRFPAARVAALTLALSGLGVGLMVVARSRTVLALATILLGAAFGADDDVLPLFSQPLFHS